MNKLKTGNLKSYTIFKKKAIYIIAAGVVVTVLCILLYNFYFDKHRFAPGDPVYAEESPLGITGMSSVPITRLTIIDDKKNNFSIARSNKLIEYKRLLKYGSAYIGKFTGYKEVTITYKGKKIKHLLYAVKIDSNVIGNDSGFDPLPKNETLADSVNYMFEYYITNKEWNKFKD